MKVRASCVDGPYAGQTFTVEIPALVPRETAPGRTDVVVAPLCWIVNGADWHGYQIHAQGVERHTYPYAFHLVHVRTEHRPAGETMAAEYGDEPYERIPS